MEKKRILLLVVALALMGAVAWIIWGNVTVGLTAITVTEENLPAAFDGFRIAHVSDLHDSRLWEKTIAQLKTAKPDIICITGDLIDCKRTDLEAALSFAAEAVTIAPCYYITGNHEFNLPSEERDALLRGLSSLNVTVLIDDEIRLEKQGQQIALAGHQWGRAKASGSCPTLKVIVFCWTTVRSISLTLWPQAMIWCCAAIPMAARFESLSLGACLLPDREYCQNMTAAITARGRPI